MEVKGREKNREKKSMPNKDVEGHNSQNIDYNKIFASKDVEFFTLFSI